MKKFCVKCGYEFDALGREIICPGCREAAAAEAKLKAVLRAKQASWTGESVPVRISGRASTVIRHYGAAHNLPFAAALDELLKASDYIASTGKAWDDITPYKSHRRDKTTSTTDPAQDETGKQDAPQEVKQDEPQAKHDVKPVKQAAKQASKASASKASKEAE